MLLTLPLPAAQSCCSPCPFLHAPTPSQPPPTPTTSRPLYPALATATVTQKTGTKKRKTGFSRCINLQIPCHLFSVTLVLILVPGHADSQSN
eukprot:356488-Chlamydomonas_euryale.AAC.1